jgi:hypothetical protein
VRARDGIEDVHDHVHEVEADPGAVLGPRTREGTHLEPLEPAHHAVGDGAVLAFAAARGDHQEVHVVGQTAHVERDDVLAAPLVDQRDDAGEQLLAGEADAR